MSAHQDSATVYRPPFEIAADFMDEAPVDLEPMANALGLSVVRDESMLDSVSGHISRMPGPYGATHRIAINARDSWQRQRFTLAHEIAHFLLHRSIMDSRIQDDRMYRSRLSDALEREANMVAAQLLMPPRLVLADWRTGLRDVRALAARNGVSEQAMAIRLRELRLAAPVPA